MSVVFGNAYHRDKDDPRLRAQAGCGLQVVDSTAHLLEPNGGVRADSRTHLEQPVITP